MPLILHQESATSLAHEAPPARQSSIPYPSSTGTIKSREAGTAAHEKLAGSAAAIKIAAAHGILCIEIAQKNADRAKIYIIPCKLVKIKTCACIYLTSNLKITAKAAIACLTGGVMGGMMIA